ncbi:hypothetical protein L9F63_009032, partial [Diploptera punctata]
MLEGKMKATLLLSADSKHPNRDNRSALGSSQNAMASLLKGPTIFYINLPHFANPLNGNQMKSIEVKILMTVNLPKSMKETQINLDVKTFKIDFVHNKNF